MRNVFDQYSQPENKLTHALMTALNEDKKLLSEFIQKYSNRDNSRNLTLIEQQLPGQDVTEEEAERKGLPDGWIYDNDNWSLLIESKVSSKLDLDQLERHCVSANMRGFDNHTVLAIVVTDDFNSNHKWLRVITWSQLYVWLKTYLTKNKSFWAMQLTRFLEISEIKFTEAKYMTEGTLTEFSGIPFNKENHYNYLEAKRIIKLMMNALLKRQVLESELDIDLSKSGRGAITGSEGVDVWDFLRLKCSTLHDHTAYPHFTLSLGRDKLYTVITIPDRVNTAYRKKLFGNGLNSFSEVLKDVYENLNGLIVKRNLNAIPTITLLQRHFLSQRSIGKVDGILEFDMRTIFKNETSKVKHQPIWLQTVYELLKVKKANTQLSVGLVFNYDNCSETQSNQILDVVVETWLGLKPLVQLL